MVARCRAVCRTWRDVTSTDAFLRAHRDRRSRHPTPLFFYQPIGDDHAGVDLRAVDIHRRVPFPVFRFAHPDPALPNAVFRIEGSCDGILLLSYDARLYACNPWTRRWSHVGLPPGHNLANIGIVGFYAGPRPSQYRVLYHVTRPDGGFNYWIRCIGNAATATSIAWPTNQVAQRVRIRPSSEMPPVEVRRHLYWLPQVAQYNSYNLLEFDTTVKPEIKRERFKWIRPPRVREAGGPWVPVEGDQLLEINGRLAMAVVAPTTVGVWVFQNNADQTWVNQYQIQLPMAVIQGHHGGALSVFVVSEDCNVLVQCANALFQSDAIGTVLVTYHLAGNRPVLSRYMLQESLLLPDCLPQPEGHAHDGDPPFFQPP